MHAHTAYFLDLLFGDVSAPDERIALTAIHPDGGQPSPTTHIALQDGPALAAALDRLNALNGDGWGVFIGIGTRRSGLGAAHRGSRQDVQRLPALYADIDRPPPHVIASLRGFSPPPTLIVASGYGTHLYWMLRRPTADLPAADALLRTLAARLGGDRLTTAQSTRLPGTRNTKPGRNRVLCEILDCEPHRRYDPDQFPDAPTPALETPAAFRTRAQGSIRGLSEVIAERLIREYGGYVKANGWIASLCPCGHGRDAPGMHFNYHPERCMGHCFGRHGRLLVKDLCRVMGIHTAAERRLTHSHAEGDQCSRTLSRC